MEREKAAQQLYCMFMEMTQEAADVIIATAEKFAEYFPMEIVQPSMKLNALRFERRTLAGDFDQHLAH